MVFKYLRQRNEPVLAPIIRPADLTPDTYTPSADVFAVYHRNCAAKDIKRVLEVGTRRTAADRKTHSRDDYPHLADEDYVRLDIRDGLDVDVIGDLHALPVQWTERFDLFIADAVFEHLERPWIAAKEVARVLTPGAPFWIVTHQCFPIHGHPSDFFRFSTEALRVIFEDAGLIVDAAEYSDQCMIVPPENILPFSMVEGWNREFPSYNMVRATGRKP
ncbi:class I SAM-dependent methyltransferase [Rhizobium sp.]|uniref:class I SAM-dependent methyltransferase n=1 Tax=Rhizobium sp. TaxID=391 RepID=UPI0028994782